MGVPCPGVKKRVVPAKNGASARFIPARGEPREHIITRDHSKYQIGPMVHTKNYQVYIQLCLPTILGPICYGPP